MSLPIYICEDNLEQRKNIENIVKNYIATTCYPFQIELSTDSPIKLLQYLTQYPTKKGLYLLDVNLQHEINGVVLASKIRTMDSLGCIVFITAHDEMAHLTFRYRVNALDYIVKDKDDITTKIKECLDLTYSYYINSTQEKDFFQIGSGDYIRMVPVEEIMFFETHQKSHFLTLYLENGRLDFRGTLSQIEESHPNFYRSHTAYVVNIKNIRYINKSDQTIAMSNGQIAYISRNKRKELLTLIEQQCISIK